MTDAQIAKRLPITRGAEQELNAAVNAKQLHAFMQVGASFTGWITERIEKYNFKENEDFVVFSEIRENPKGGRPAKEYALSVDMAKELAMDENTPVGRRVRQYFIAVEKEYFKALEQGHLDTGLIIELLVTCDQVLNMHQLGEDDDS